MWALAESGVKFREIVNDGGTIERWQQPELADREVPHCDPNEPRPNAPEVVAPRRAAVQRWREREAAQRRYETDFPTSLRGDAEWSGARDAQRINADFEVPDKP
jgi:hypothetical protein